MKRIMIKAENCKGCKNCSIACMQAHSKNGSEALHSLNLSDPTNESRNLILHNDKNEYKPLFCRHCAQPECVNACMSGALSKNNYNGFVRCDANKCAACFMCVMSCPFGVLKPDKTTKKTLIKCDFCAQMDDQPSCVKACRSQAIYVEEV